MRTLHTLAQKNKIIKDFFVFDTETNGLRAQPDAFIFGAIYGWNFHKVLFSVEDFITEFKESKYYNKKVFAHNAEYDLNVIYSNIYDLDPNAIFNNKFICASNGNCLFADSTNIYPASVKKIGDLIKLEKLETNQDFKDGTFEGTVSETDIKYCIRDCEIIYNALFEIFNEVQSIKITIAGLSMTYFRRFYQKFHIDYNEKKIEKFYEGYYGGRTEAFFIGKTNACVYDVNSMYPYAMLNCKFPNPKFLKQLHNVNVSRFSNYFLHKFEGTAKVKLFHVEHFFGYLPYRHKGKLLFPVGTFTGWYNFNELRFAISQGVVKIKKVYEIVYSEPMDTPFDNFVTDIYKKRKETTSELQKLFLKLLMNSLYGKFGQKIKSEIIYIKDIDKQFKEIQEYQRKKILIKIIPFNSHRKDCHIEIKTKKSFLYHSIPVFSSYITSFARVELLKLLIKYKKSGPLYCDTDSIFFKNDPEIKNSDEIGRFKKENKIVTEIRGLKNYSYIGESRSIFDCIKGIPKNAEKKEGKYYYRTLIKTKEAVRRGKTAGVLVDRVKELTGEYNKRIILNDGNTKPIKF
jgi:hypothetical protein